MRPLTAADVARYPVPGANAPVSAAFSSSGRYLAYLWSPEHSLRRDLFVLDLADGSTKALLGAGAAGVTEDNLTLDERLRRERSRNLGQGVTSLAWAKERDRLLVPQRDGLHVLDAPEFTGRLAVAAVGSPMLDPQLSPDGTRVAFVRDGEVWVAPLDGGEPEQITRGAVELGRTNGLAEFVAQEEMGRDHGFWWSPDGARIAFTEVDESHIPVFRIMHQGSDAVGDGAQEDHRYPFAGEANAKVRLGVVSTNADRRPDVVWMDLGDDWEYLARVDWLSDSALAAQVQNREQTMLCVRLLDAASGRSRELLREASEVWVNLHNALRPVDHATFLWASERTGLRHLELRSSEDGSLVRTLTSGQWAVENVVKASENAVWFVATEASPLERHVYEVPVTGGQIRRLTEEPGMHAATVHAASGRFVDLWSSLAVPARAAVRSLADGALERWVRDPAVDTDPRVGELALDPPALTTVVTDDGATLHVALYAPDGAPPHPTVVSVYGGPHSQQVGNTWSMTVAMRRQWLRRLGYLVVVADNRGSAARGLDFEGAIRWDAGNLEVADQAAVVRELASRGLVDAERVGITGWSYGGYASAMALARAPDVFKVAVAGAPVTHWDGYDTHYTERYMGTPASNPEGYERSSVMTHVAGMRDRHLMLVHGLIDENVHFRHTARLVNALIRERIPYELLLFPNERHSPRSLADRVYMEERIAAFLEAHL